MMPASAYHSGQLSINEPLTTAALDGVAVRVETSLLDVALQMARSPYRQLLVQTPDGEIAGVVSDNDLLSFLSRTDVDDSGNWKTRGVESVMPVRFRRPIESSPSTGIARIDAEAARTGSTLDCVPIVVDEQLVAVQTHDDLLLSWSQLQPLVRSATTDELTTLANRAVFQRRLSEEWSRSLRFGEPLGLLLIDLDGFKEINDSLGHLAGDAVLAEFGACLRRTLRLYDVVARFGGDEFAALCCNCNPSGIAAPIQRLLAGARQLPLPCRQTDLKVSVSIGAAVVTGGFDRLSKDVAHCVTLNGSETSELVRIGSDDELSSGVSQVALAEV